MAMEKTKIKHLLENCKSGSSSKVMDSLMSIRNDVIRSGWGIQQLRECGGVEVLVSLLKKQRENILELALSTLGNCCMDERTSLAVGELGATSQLVTIIKGLGKDRLIGRACRLLGNLAQQSSNAELLMSEGAAPILVSIINNVDKASSTQTLTMTVRAVRLLWANSKQQDEILSCEAVRAVTVLLCARCEASGLLGASQDSDQSKYTTNKEEEQLIKGLLKCLGHFTSTANYKCAEQLVGGKGFQCLVLLSKHYEDLASKCLVNLCYVGPCRPLLGAAGAVECLVNLIKSHKEYPECYLNAICMLCREAVNRAKLRQCGGLTILMDVVKDTSHLSRHTTALRTLLLFVFDDISFHMLINYGLINVIEEQLTEYVKAMKCGHQLRSKHKGASAANKPDTAEAGKIAEAEEEEKCEIVIERDNMMIGFNDAFTISDDEDSDVDRSAPHGRKRSRKSNSLKDVSLEKMAKYDWSTSGISCEPKSDPNYLYGSESPLSGYSPTGSTSPSANSATRHVYVHTSRRLDHDRSPDFSEGCSYSNAGSWSPGSPNSICCSSRCDDSSDSEKSERYSPVCSDVDEERQEEEREGHSAHMANEMEDLVLDEDSLSIKELELEESSLHQSIPHRTRCLLVLLSRASHTDSGIESLASPKLLLALLSYVRNARNPANRAFRILARIVSYTTHIIRLLKHRLVLHLYQMLHHPRHSECGQCHQLKVLSRKLISQLRMVAESEYGIGEISYQLQKGGAPMKHSLALTLPYIIKAHRPLKKFLINCKAFELLFDMVACDQEPLELSVPSMFQLARSLNIKDPKSLEHSFSSESEAFYEPFIKSLEEDQMVNFILDDSSRVQAKKQLLCQESDVFNAMFSGAFKESCERSVQLKNVSKDSLEYLLTLLNCGINSKDTSTDVFPMPQCLGTSLAALLLADKFLLERIKSLLFSAIIQFKLMWNTAKEIYVWSLQEGMGLLCVEAVAYMLAGDMSDAQRLGVVASIVETRYKRQLVEDMKSIIIRHFK